MTTPWSFLDVVIDEVYKEIESKGINRLARVNAVDKRRVPGMPNCVGRVLGVTVLNDGSTYF